MNRLAVVALPLVFSAATVLGAPAEAPRFVGEKACRTCHSKAPKDSYHSWLNSKHSRAYSLLRGPDRTNPHCLACHVTGQGERWAAEVKAEDLRGVQCEACHGPGSLYKPVAVMKDRKQALAKGLTLPTKKVCLKCHR